MRCLKTSITDKGRNDSLRLWVEWPIVLVVLVGLIVLLRPHSSAWWTIPALLLMFSLLHHLLSRQSLSSLGLQWGHVRLGWKKLAWACFGGLPLGISGVIILHYWGWAFAGPIIFASKQQWFFWILTQFVYIAFPEELFFRGYLQNRLHQLIPHHPIGVILLSSGLFGLVHMIIQGTPSACLTVLPAILLGWLYWQTQSLLTPILFHAVCNITLALTLNFLV